MLTHLSVFPWSSEGRRVLLVHCMCKADQKLIGSSTRLLVHFFDTQDDLTHHAGHHLHAFVTPLALSECLRSCGAGRVSGNTLVEQTAGQRHVQAGDGGTATEYLFSQVHRFPGHIRNVQSNDSVLLTHTAQE